MRVNGYIARPRRATSTVPATGRNSRIVLRVFVDERAVTVAAGAVARDAVAALDPALLAGLDAGTAYLTDGRGIRLEAGAPLAPGSIVRVVRSARRGEDADADA